MSSTLPSFNSNYGSLGLLLSSQNSKNNFTNFNPKDRNSLAKLKDTNVIASTSNTVYQADELKDQKLEQQEYSQYLSVKAASPLSLSAQSALVTKVNQFTRDDNLDYMGLFNFISRSTKY